MYRTVLDHKLHDNGTEEVEDNDDEAVLLQCTRSTPQYWIRIRALILYIHFVTYFIEVHALFCENDFRVFYKAEELLCKLFGKQPGKQNTPRVLFCKLVT